MTHREQSLALLVALVDLARAGRPAEVPRLAGRLGLALTDTEAAIARLASVGLVGAARGRTAIGLTMTGLALASTLAEQRDRRRISVAA